MLDLSDAFAIFPVLETERLVLRAPQFEDAAAMFQVMSNPDVMRYFGSAPMQTLTEATERIADMQAAFQQQQGIRWIMTKRGSDQLIGSCGFWRLIKPHFRAEIGYELAAEEWGQGLMPEALRAALTFGFGPMGLHSVEAQIDPDNSGSRRVLEKLGFVQEAYFRESFYEPRLERFTDTAVFSLVKTDWQSLAR